MNAPGPRYPIEPLLALTGLGRNRFSAKARISWDTAKLGLTFDTADRVASLFGYHPGEVWPEWTDEAIARLPRASCVICGTSFVPEKGTGRWRTCSARCSRINGDRQRHESVKRLRGTPDKRECVVCGAEFAPRKGGPKSCSRRCQRKRELQMSLARERRNNGTADTRECAECGEEFPNRMGGPTICGKDECRRARQARRAREQRARKKLAQGVANPETMD